MCVVGVSVAIAGIWGVAEFRRAERIRDLQVECRQWQSDRNWPKLLMAAKEWRSIEPQRLEALVAGGTAAKELRQVAITADFLYSLPRKEIDEIPSLSILADLQFGPLKRPVLGAQTCRDILRLDPSAVLDRQKLVFFYAVTAQPAELLMTIRAGAEQGSDLPEFYIYAFLADGLRMQNAMERLQQWMTGRNELLMVAYTLHAVRNLDGSIPSMNEQKAEAIRRHQKQRDFYLAEVRKMFPDNHQLLVYDLDQAVQSGTAMSVARLLARATPAADADFRCWRARGWLFLHVQQYDEARLAFDEALKLHPLDWRTRYYLADWARRTGDLSHAETLHRLAARGKSLEAALLESPDIRSVSSGHLQRLADFAADCGDEVIATRLRQQLEAENAQEDRLDPLRKKPTKSKLK